MGDPIDQTRIVEELSPQWIETLSSERRERARAVLAELVASWAVEADARPNPNAVLRFQREDLEAAAGANADRLAVLERELLRRKVDELNARTYQLGLAILDGELGESERRERGRGLLTEAEQFGQRAKSLGLEPADPIRRSLSDAVMEALYAVEGRAMSARLDRARAERLAR